MLFVLVNKFLKAAYAKPRFVETRKATKLRTPTDTCTYLHAEFCAQEIYTILQARICHVQMLLTARTKFCLRK